MTQPNALIVAGYGINCEDETAFAFEKAGASASIVHVNDLIKNSASLEKYQILVIPGGFSYGDDTGAGNAMANKIRSALQDSLQKFIEADKLVLGICNGFQVLVALGLLPSLYGTYGLVQTALVANDNARYTVRWVDLKVSGNSPWLKGIDRLSLPIAHGEGKFYAPDDILEQLKLKKMVAASYVEGEVCRHFELEVNPNGSLEDIAAITDESGRVLGIMPHPERAISFTQLPHWTYLKEKLVRSGKEVPSEGSGLEIFRNAVRWFN